MPQTGLIRARIRWGSQTSSLSVPSKERRDAGDEAAARRLRELEEIAAAAASTKQEPERLNLLQPGEYGLFTILRAHAPSAAESYFAHCARKMVGHLRTNKLLSSGWSNSIGGRMRVEQSLLAESSRSAAGEGSFVTSTCCG